MRTFIALLPWLAACQPSYTDDQLAELDAESRGLTGEGLLYPFPNAQLMQDGHVALPVDDFPGTETPLPASISWRTGFSGVATGVVRLRDVDPASLPSWRDHTPGEGGVRLVDLTAGTYLPVMAELDAYCAAEDPDYTDACGTWPDEPPALLIRPQAAIPVGHRVAMVVTTEAAPRPQRFDNIVAGSRGKIPDDFAHRADHYRDLLVEIEAGVGLAADDVAIAWDFPVADGTQPLRSALSQLVVHDEWRLLGVRNLDDGDEVAETGWRSADGWYTTTTFLQDDLNLTVDASGNVTPNGTDEAYFWVHIPQSVKDAPEGSVPVIVIGHGIFGSIRDFLDTNDANPFIELANDHGYILIGTNQRGLDRGDSDGAVNVARDFGKINTIPDRMAQGQVNQRTLIEMVRRDAFTSDPIFHGAAGQPLVDTSRTYYWGISMGGILGGVASASGAPVERSVLHIAGSSWSTLLERSGAWTLFETFMVDNVANPTDRQLLYSASQLWWDVSDPIAWPELAERELLIQEAKGDESVHNIGTRMLARSLDLPVLAPPVDLPPGMTEQAGPIPARALAQFDPGVTEPDDWNRPANTGGAHGASWGWVGSQAQTAHFFATGEVKHFCGEDACTRFNRGSLD